MNDMRTKLAIISACLLACLITACESGTGEFIAANSENPIATNTPGAVITGAGAADTFEDCTGILDLEDVQAASGRSDVTAADDNVNSGSQSPNASGIKAMCIYEYVTPEILVGGPAELRVSGPTMTLTGVLFDSEESSEAHYRFSLDNVKLLQDEVGADVDITEGLVGEDSYQLTANAEGIGTIVGFLSGPYVMQLHTTLPDGEAPLLDPQALQKLAGKVQDRLKSP